MIPGQNDKKLKARSRQKFRRAVKQGKIKKPDKCDQCGLPGKVEGHHVDYNKPFEVRWLCPSCHAALHSGVRLISKKRLNEIAANKREEEIQVMRELNAHIPEEEKAKIIADYKEQQKRELSEKMRKLGKIRSPKKRRTALENIRKAQAVKWGKKFPGMKPRKP